MLDHAVSSRTVELSVLIPALDEAESLRVLLPELRTALTRMNLSFEILVVDGGSTDETRGVAESSGARFLRQSRKGYGNALGDGFEAARGDYVLTMDADYSHEPSFIASLWAAREAADVVIASRYVEGGSAEMSPLRALLSRLLNRVYRRFLDLEYHDLSSGFRLYRVSALATVEPVGHDFDYLPELLVLLYAQGYRIREIPFSYRPRKGGRSHAKLLKFGWAYARTLVRMRRLRVSVRSADYDSRAFDSLIPFQRYWQRKRFEIVTGYLDPDGPVLDIGCGSSRIIQSLPRGVGLDVQLNKLRFLRGRVPMLLASSLSHLPFRDRSFNQVVCSEVIEHVPRDRVNLSEFRRVLAPGGTLVLGTPDYSSRIWTTIERVYGTVCPGGYAHEHINHYTEEGLRRELEDCGFRVDVVKKICRSEMIFKAVRR
jgi:dolichol-phosphate mannosyltransferase